MEAAAEASADRKPKPLTSDDEASEGEEDMMDPCGASGGFTTVWSEAACGNNIQLRNDRSIARLCHACCYPSIRTEDPLPSSGTYYWVVRWDSWRWYGQAFGVVGAEASSFDGSGSEGEGDLSDGPAWFIKYPDLLCRVSEAGQPTERIGNLDRRDFGVEQSVLVDMDTREIKFFNGDVSKMEEPVPIATIDGLPDKVYPAVTLAYQVGSKCRLRFKELPGMGLPTKAAGKTV